MASAAVGPLQRQISDLGEGQKRYPRPWPVLKLPLRVDLEQEEKTKRRNPEFPHQRQQSHSEKD